MDIRPPIKLTKVSVFWGLGVLLVCGWCSNAQKKNMQPPKVEKFKSILLPCGCAVHQEELSSSQELVLKSSCGFWFGLESNLNFGKQPAGPAVAALKTLQGAFNCGDARADGDTQR